MDGENQRANDNDRYVLAAQPGQVAGAAKQNSSRSKRIVQSGLPGCVLPESPCPGSPDRTVRAGQQPSEDDFHATNNRSATRPDPLHPVHKHDVGCTRAPDRTVPDDRRHRIEADAVAMLSLSTSLLRCAGRRSQWGQAWAFSCPEEGIMSELLRQQGGVSARWRRSGPQLS
jgi:hypothetical protein